MSEIITRPIGSHFKCNGVELVVVENTRGVDGYCGGEVFPCYFGDNCSGRDKDMLFCRGCCSDLTRTDGKDVYFREVEL